MRPVGMQGSIRACISKIGRAHGWKLPCVVAAALVALSCGRSAPASSADSVQRSGGEDRPGGGRIECAELVYDFGRADNTESVEHTFVLRNSGKEPLHIYDVHTSCGCTVAELPDESKVLQPGQEAKLKVSLDLRGRVGAQKKQIRVSSSDVDTPGLMLQLKGTAEEPIRIRPAAANFGAIRDDNSHSLAVSLEAAREDVEFNVVEVENPLKEFNVETIVTEPGKKHTLIIANREPLPPDNYSGNLKIVTDNPRYKELQIRLSARVYGYVVVSPSTLPFQEGSETGVTGIRRLRVLPGRNDAFKVTEVIPPLDAIAVQIEELADSRYLISLTNVPQTGDLEGKELVIRTDHPKQPEVRVPFKRVQVQAPPVRSSS